LALEILHDIKEFIVYIGQLMKLNFDLVKIAQSILKTQASAHKEIQRSSGSFIFVILTFNIGCWPCPMPAVPGPGGITWPPRAVIRGICCAFRATS
jgi:hypothetical protein